MHVDSVHRNSSVYRPGLTKTQTSSRVAPLEMEFRHRRQRLRPVGALLMRYVLRCCLKPLLLLSITMDSIVCATYTLDCEQFDYYHA